MAESDLTAARTDFEFGKLPSSKVDGFGAEQTPAAVQTASTWDTVTIAQEKGDSSARLSRGYSSMEEARDEPLDNGQEQRARQRNKLTSKRDIASAERAWNFSPERMAQQSYYPRSHLCCHNGGIRTKYVQCCQRWA